METLALLTMAIIGILLFAGVVRDAAAQSTGDAWQVVGPRAVLEDAAVAAGVKELEAAFGEAGLGWSITEERAADLNALVLDIGEMTVQLPAGVTGQEAHLITESAYQITDGSSVPRSMRIRAGSPLGLAYALFAVADRVRVHGLVPALDTVVVPALPYRIVLVSAPLGTGHFGADASPASLASAQEAFEKQAARAAKHGYNFVVILNTEDYVPWTEPPYRSRNECNRKYLERFIESAHAYHLKLLLMGDEFVYLPELMARFNARPSVKDEALWQALASKYRDLLAACPDLDGIGTRLGEVIPKFEFRALDLIHSPEPEPDPRIEERYRRFIKTMHQVVVEEFGKLFFHRTWAVNVHEQHSVPGVYARTFTDDMPNENLLISIKLTAGDQWYPYEPYNATFGVTPHTTIAHGELYSGYQGRGTYIDYPARYFQAALEWAVDRGARGTFTSFGSECLQADAILYVFSHLGWDPKGSVDVLTEDWAAATFGREVRKEIADIFLSGSAAVRDGIYLRQPGLRNWEPIRHLRTDCFVLKGNPMWDHGRAHDRFLNDIYLECKPWLPQTLSELDNAVEICDRMRTIYEGCRDRIGDAERAAALERLLLHGRAAIQLNRDYVMGFLTYFQYREHRTPEHKASLTDALKRLRKSAADYEQNFDYYNLVGVGTFMDLAGRALQDLDEAERVLREAPTREDILRMFAEARSASEQLLRDHPDALRLATWQGTIDGRDLLMIRGDTFRIEHIEHDRIHSALLTVHNGWPTDGPYSVVIKPVEVRGAAYIQEQPTAENGNTVTIYLEDLSPGQTVFRFELYAVRQ